MLTDGGLADEPHPSLLSSEELTGLLCPFLPWCLGQQSRQQAIRKWGSMQDLSLPLATLQVQPEPWFLLGVSPEHPSGLSSALSALSCGALLPRWQLAADAALLLLLLLSPA